MIRRKLRDAGVGKVEGIRWRGKEVSRLEGFSDSVFAFALTLIVVSLEVPHTFNDLVGTMKGFIPFGICFAFIIQLWRAHYLYFRHFGLEDTITMVLNALLLFVVLFYVYPLKFVVSLGANSLMGGPDTVRLPDGTLQAIIQPGQSGTMMLIYSTGFITVWVLYALLYVHALNQREQLELTPLEVFDTKTRLTDFLIYIAAGLISIVIILILGSRGANIAGFSYFLIGVGMSVHRSIAGRRRRKFEEEMGLVTG